MNSQAFKHSAAHVLAAALVKLYPEIKLATGPATQNGYYYDFELPKSITPHDLGKIQKQMRKIISQNLPIKKERISIDRAKKIFKKLNQTYKLELIDDLIKKEGKKPVTIYKIGGMIDLCKGPHLKSTKELNARGIQLTKLSGAYWKADEKNKMLQRIYGLAFSSKEKMEKFIQTAEQAKQRDHRKIGKELDLFITSDLVGKGLPLLTPKGAAIRQELEKFIIEEEFKRDYQRTFTPDLARTELYKKSGHWQHYRESMYPAVKIENESYVLRPMTCPHQFMIYNSRPRSYRELPIRYAELAKLYRREQSGELSGLIRVMSFTLADAHIICRPDQVEKEFQDVVELVQFCMKTLGIKDFWYRFSKWNPKNKKKYVDKPEEWEKTQKFMKKILANLKLKYVETRDEAAFYGPKLDVQVKNANGKEDTAVTIQIDFDLPEKFDMTYIDENGEKQRPMIIHRSSIGCIERTMAFLIEHYAGAFPVWLSPVQAVILPVSEKFNSYGRKIKSRLKKNNFRIEIDDSNQSLGKKIRQAQAQKIPYMLIVGQKEKDAGSVAIRKRDGGDQGVKKLSSFIETLKEEIQQKK
ncbi:threonine--tRNA ligase [Patescibacteria group bacterium]|nr:threonine--tRNA ligase [Patescibacteria group bacterium]